MFVYVLWIIDSPFTNSVHTGWMDCSIIPNSHATFLRSTTGMKLCISKFRSYKYNELDLEKLLDTFHGWLLKEKEKQFNLSTFYNVLLASNYNFIAKTQHIDSGSVQELLES